MGRVEYPLQQPDSNMDGAGLDTFLTNMQTQTGSLDGTNFRDRGLDHRAVGSEVVAELMGTGPIVHTTRANQIRPDGTAGMSAGSWVLLNPGTSFETPDFSLAQYEIVELEASIYVSASLTGTAAGRLAGDTLGVRIEVSTNGTGGPWAEIVGSQRWLGATVAAVPGQYGNNEPEANHGSLHPFAVYTAALGGAVPQVRFRVAAFSNNSIAMFFEDSQFYGIRLRRL